MTLLYLRYIDDIFIIWKGTKVQLITFMNELNKKHETIKSKYEISSQKIPFLDTMVYRSSHQRCSIKKGVLRNFGKFTGKHLCQSQGSL